MQEERRGMLDLLKEKRKAITGELLSECALRLFAERDREFVESLGLRSTSRWMNGGDSDLSLEGAAIAESVNMYVEALSADIRGLKELFAGYRELQAARRGEEKARVAAIDAVVRSHNAEIAKLKAADVAAQTVEVQPGCARIVTEFAHHLSRFVGAAESPKAVFTYRVTARDCGVEE